MKSKKKMTCAAKLVDNTVQYCEQSGKIKRLPLKKSTLNEARRVLRQAMPNINWIIA